MHLHLDGGIFLHSTAYELLRSNYDKILLKSSPLLTAYYNSIEKFRAKNLTLPGNGSYEAFQEAFNPISPAKLPYLVLFTLIPSSVEYSIKSLFSPEFYALNFHLGAI